MQLIDGKAVSASVRARVKQETEELKKQGVTPGLAVIIVGDDPASQVYVRNKEKACAEVGFYSEKYALPSSTTQQELNNLVQELNSRKEINGILCQLPLPGHLNDKEVIELIDPVKDVDAFHPVNVGRIMIGDYDLLPCTPAGIMELIMRGVGAPLLTGIWGFSGACASNPLAWIGACIPLAAAYYLTIRKIETKKSAENPEADTQESENRRLSAALAGRFGKRFQLPGRARQMR